MWHSNEITLFLTTFCVFVGLEKHKDGILRLFLFNSDSCKLDKSIHPWFWGRRFSLVFPQVHLIFSCYAQQKRLLVLRKDKLKILPSFLPSVSSKKVVGAWVLSKFSASSGLLSTCKGYQMQFVEHNSRYSNRQTTSSAMVVCNLTGCHVTRR